MHLLYLELELDIDGLVLHVIDIEVFHGYELHRGLLRANHRMQSRFARRLVLEKIDGSYEGYK